MISHPHNTTAETPTLSRKAGEVVGCYVREKLRFPADDPANPDTILAEFALPGDGDGDPLLGVPTLTTCKGPAYVGELLEGMDYRLFGKWKSYTHPRTKVTEEQFVFDSFVPLAPASREAVISYLSAAGEGFGLGRGRAARLWQEYGPDAVRMMREQPLDVAQRLAEHKLKLTDENARRIAAELEAKKAIEGCSLDLQTLLNKRGMPRMTDRWCIAKWGNRAAQTVRRNPYVLLRFKGIGFKKCDSLYLDLGGPKDWIVRQGCAAWYAIAKETQGNIWFPMAVAERGVIATVGREQAKFEKALRFAKLAGGLREITTDKPRGPLTPGGSVRWVAERGNADHETQIAEAVVAAQSETARWPDVSIVEGITASQRDHLRKAISGGPIGILGGGPGTGKTHVVGCLLSAMAKHGYSVQAMMPGAPTGKAAVRVTENLCKHGLDLRARTWDSHYVGLRKREAQEKSRLHFSAKVLIGDEESMRGNDNAAAFFRYRAAGSLTLFVGDYFQLPPVAPGAFLRDLIFAGLPYGELTEIMRNSGGIVEACAAIRQGRKFTLGDNLTLADASTPDAQIAAMLETIKRAKARGLDPIWDVQPLAAVNEDSPLARTTLNKILQAELNPSPGVSNRPFRVRDKVVCLKNGKYKNATGEQVSEEGFQDETTGEIYVANGELAEVVSVDDSSFVAKLKNPDRQVRIYRNKQDGDKAKKADDDEGGASDSAGDGGSSAKWDLGYCLSVHKSQGSEWPIVIPMLDTYMGAKRVASREWLYTAISRAKSHCKLVGELQTAHAMCARVSLRDRKTFLAEKIGLGIANNLLAGW